MQLDNKMKLLLRELGRAINESVSGSPRLAESISRIRASGYDVFLMLDAVVGLSRHANGEPAAAPTGQDRRFLKSLKIRLDEEAPAETDPAVLETKKAMTPQDLKFLKDLRINVDDLH